MSALNEDLWSFTDRIAKEMNSPQVWWEGTFKKALEPKTKEEWKAIKTGNLTPFELYAKFPNVNKSFWERNDLEDSVWWHNCKICEKKTIIECLPNEFNPYTHICNLCILNHCP